MKIEVRPLADLLRAKMERDGLSSVELAERLGIGQSYLSQLLRGVKRTQTAGESLLRACAKYLGVPPVTAYLLAGKLKAEDFFSVTPKEWDVSIDNALFTLSQSHFAANAAVTHEHLRQSTDPLKLLLIHLFENATSTTLLPRRFVESDIAHFGTVSVPFAVRTHRQDK